MALYTTTRRSLGPILTPSRTITTNTPKQVRLFKGIRNIKCNAYIQSQRQPMIRFRKGNRGLSQSTSPLNLCVCPGIKMKEGPIAAYWRYYVEAKKAGSRASNKGSPMSAYWRYYEEVKESGSPTSSKVSPIPAYWRYYVEAKAFDNPTPSKVSPMAADSKYYAEAKEPGSPTRSRGGPVTTSGGGLGKLDAAKESGFFHKASKSKLDEMKQMLKEKRIKRKEDDDKTDSK